MRIQLPPVTRHDSLLTAWVEEIRQLRQSDALLAAGGNLSEGFFNRPLLQPAEPPAAEAASSVGLNMAPTRIPPDPSESHVIGDEEIPPKYGEIPEYLLHYLDEVSRDHPDEVQTEELNEEYAKKLIEHYPGLKNHEIDVLAYGWVFPADLRQKRSDLQRRPGEKNGDYAIRLARRYGLMQDPVGEDFASKLQDTRRQRAEGRLALSDLRLISGATDEEMMEADKADATAGATAPLGLADHVSPSTYQLPHLCLTYNSLPAEIEKIGKFGGTPEMQAAAIKVSQFFTLLKGDIDARFFESIKKANLLGFYTDEAIPYKNSAIDSKKRFLKAQLRLTSWLEERYSENGISNKLTTADFHLICRCQSMMANEVSNAIKDPILRAHLYTSLPAELGKLGTFGGTSEMRAEAKKFSQCFVLMKADLDARFFKSIKKAESLGFDTNEAIPYKNKAIESKKEFLKAQSLLTSWLEKCYSENGFSNKLTRDDYHLIRRCHSVMANEVSKAIKDENLCAHLFAVPDVTMLNPI